VLSLLAVLALGGISAYAGQQPISDVVIEPAEISLVSPFWANTSHVAATLSFDNGRASLGGSVLGHPGTTNISVNAVLERRNANGTYSFVNSWPNLNARGEFWMWSTNHWVARGHTYRLTLNATVYRNGFGENVSLSVSRFAD
jgi:hypothetical protein